MKEETIMDRRQQKTRTAIFTAFSTLLSEKSYSKITVQEIIDSANVGEQPFMPILKQKMIFWKPYAKNYSVILSAALQTVLTPTDSIQKAGCPTLCSATFFNTLRKIIAISWICFPCENNEIFLRYFKDSLNKLVQIQFVEQKRNRNSLLPTDFLINHISSSFVEMVLWWIKGGQKQSPEELDQYFRFVMEPIL